MRYLLLLFSLTMAAFGQDDRIDVRYRLINDTTTPESMSEGKNIGVLVFVRTSSPQVGAINILLSYVDSTTGETLTVDKIVRRKVTHAGYQTSALPVLFNVEAKSVVGITAYGMASTPTIGFIGPLSK